MDAKQLALGGQLSEGYAPQLVQWCEVKSSVMKDSFVFQDKDIFGDKPVGFFFF